MSMKYKMKAAEHSFRCQCWWEL